MKLVEHISGYVARDGESEHRYIRDEHVPVFATSCGHDGRERRSDENTPVWQLGSRRTDHSAAVAPKSMQPAQGRPGLALLDCPCDVACPRCESGVGEFCTTLDGGGTSGGGFRTNWHSARVKASPRCRAIASGERTRCDLGDHEWSPAATGSVPTACCQLCGTSGQYTPAKR